MTWKAYILLVFLALIAGLSLPHAGLAHTLARLPMTTTEPRRVIGDGSVDANYPLVNALAGSASLGHIPQRVSETGPAPRPATSPAPQPASTEKDAAKKLPDASGALPLLSLIGFGVLVGGIASALKTRYPDKRRTRQKVRKAGGRW